MATKENDAATTNEAEPTTAVEESETAPPEGTFARMAWDKARGPHLAS